MTATDDYRQIIKDNLKKLSENEDIAELIIETLLQADSESTKENLLNKVLPEGKNKKRIPRGQRTLETAKEVTLETETTDQYLRPNGSTYYPRTWGEHQDVATLRQARKATTQSFTQKNLSPMFTLLYGAPGTGKTALVEAAFGTIHTVLGTGDTDSSDFLGGFTQKPSGGYEWVDGALLKAAENGEVLFIDEIGLVDPKVLSIVYGAMDGRREIEVTTNPARGTVKIHPEFYVVAATNPNAPGVRLSEALLSRFNLQVEMTTDWKLADKLKVDKTMLVVASNLNKKQINNEISWSPQMREMLAFRDIQKTFGLQFAIQNLIASAPEMDRPVVCELLSNAYGKEFKPARI